MLWHEEYEQILKCQPSEGTILRTLTGEPLRLEVVLKDGKPPFIFGRAYVPELVGCALGWYAQGDENWTGVGWKCVLMTKARHEIVKRYGLSGEIRVRALRVIRVSKSGKALLCEVSEWLPSDSNSKSETDCPTESNSLST